jgi:hypothetical protein
MASDHSESHDQFHLAKQEWGPGPWQNEVDFQAWDYMGFSCIAVRHEHFGHFCGYLAVPPDHPWHGQSDEDLMGEEEGAECVDVHGGITYSALGQVYLARHKGIGSEDWCIGFDCGHSGDLMPGMEASLGRLRELTDQATLTSPSLPFWGESVYRTLSYVRYQVNRMAHQAYRATKLKEIRNGK